MIQEKDEMTGGPAREAANDRDGRADEVAGADVAGADATAAELRDEGIPVSAEDRLAAVEGELAETKDRLLRALAETENVRRRLQRERDDARKYAASDFAKDLLSPVDNLRRALDAMPEAEVTDARAKRLRDGVAATELELLAASERHGLKRIDPKVEMFSRIFPQAI